MPRKQSSPKEIKHQQLTSHPRLDLGEDQAVPKGPQPPAAHVAARKRRLHIMEWALERNAARAACAARCWPGGLLSWPQQQLLPTNSGASGCAFVRHLLVSIGGVEQGAGNGVGCLDLQREQGVGQSPGRGSDQSSKPCRPAAHLPLKDRIASGSMRLRC